MKKWWLRSAAGAAVAMVISAPVYAPLIAAQAQPPATDPAPPATADTNVQKLMLTTVVSQMKRESGVTVLLDRSVPAQDVAPLGGTTTVDNLEDQLSALTKALPKGTVWAKVNLPDKGRTYSGDAVADYVIAQASLFGGAGAATPAGTIEVMGQKISGDKAQTVSDALALKPVYVLLNPTNRPAAGTPGLNPNWANLTPEQKQQQASQAAQALLNMTPEQRAGVMQQQMQTMQAMMQGMTPEQRQQMMQGMGGMRGGGGPGGGGRGRRGQ